MTQTLRDDILAEQERHKREDVLFIPIERSNRLFTQQDDLSGLDLPYGAFRDSTFAGTNMERIILTSANMEQTRLLEARLDFASMQDVNLQHASLLGCSLHEADLRFARASYVQFLGCPMPHALLHSAYLYCALFGGTPLEMMDLSHTDWRSSTLRLRNIHDRIGGKSEREELIDAKASDGGHSQRERAGGINPDYQAPSKRAASGIASAHRLTGGPKVLQCTHCP